jgi:Sulfatase.
MNSELVRKIGLAVRNPALVGRVLNRKIHSTVPQWNYAKRGKDFLDADWDNLLILDACRYDLFEEYHTLPGRLSRRQSKAASTVDFLQTNLHCRDLFDTVYVTANGQLFHFHEEFDIQFHDVVPLYAEAWNNELGTVTPDDVTDAAIEVANQYPNKRLLVHYVQPHFPFIGADTQADKKRKSDNEEPFWLRVATGDVDINRDSLWKAYRNTFQMMLPEVKRLMKKLHGKTIVTSDHGNMFGERAHPVPIREWGHPSGIYTPELVEVPWLIYESGERRRIVAEVPDSVDMKPDPAVVEKRLKDLGYK